MQYQQFASFSDFLFSGFVFAFEFYFNICFSIQIEQVNCNGQVEKPNEGWEEKQSTIWCHQINGNKKAALPL